MESVFLLASGIASIWFLGALFAAIFPGNRRRRLKHAGGAFLVSVIMAAVHGDDTASNAPDDQHAHGEQAADAGSAGVVIPVARPEREPEPVKTVSLGDALDMCERVAKASATHPSTVRISRFMNADLRKYTSGASFLTTTFRARNSFNLELTFNITCMFEGEELVDYSISES